MRADGDEKMAGAGKLNFQAGTVFQEFCPRSYYTKV